MKKYNIENPYDKNYLMQRTIDLANIASRQGEVPVAAIIVNKDTQEIISEATNLVEHNDNAICHAELIAINSAMSKLRSKYCTNTAMYVNLQPCQMCYSAICIAKIPVLYYGAYDQQNGYLYHHAGLYKPQIYGGIMETESQKIIKNFFQKLR